VDERPTQCHVLLVDDEPQIPLLLSQKLSAEGFQCHTAFAGKDALDLIQPKQFDVVISDLRMPEVSGLDLLERVRQHSPHTAFLMATGVADLGVGIQAMKQGADDYIVKPFHLDAVVASVRRAVEKKRMELELENYRGHLEEMVEQRTAQLEAAMHRVELTYDETLEALGAALDLRDNETAGHSQRVTRYSLAMAGRMGCSAAQLTYIARGAYMHDIGKIGIPDSILLKPGKLTPEERAVMETHARIGYDLLCRIAFLVSAAEIVLTHQERYDGTGYPQGLTGAEIPLGARIFAAADTLDAMTSDRPYRKALPYSKAREEIKRESGRQFDPEVVGVFLSIPEQEWGTIRLDVLMHGGQIRRWPEQAFQTVRKQAGSSEEPPIPDTPTPS
jgi:response regulator RpfG family c-di-GMP phosphodiesterase